MKTLSKTMTSTNFEPLLGLVELDADGTVLYFNNEKDKQTDTDTRGVNLIGKNFFDELVNFSNVKEFKATVNNFKLSHSPAHSFDFTIHTEHGSTPVRVLLARISDRSEIGRRESIFVHIRKAR